MQIITRESIESPLEGVSYVPENVARVIGFLLGVAIASQMHTKPILSQKASMYNLF